MTSFVSSTYNQLFSILPTLRKPRNFFLYILPFSIILGRVIPSSFAASLNEAGLAMVQLIAFPAIPLVLSAVMISIASIFSVSDRSPEDRIRFSGRFIAALVSTIVLAALLALLLSVYQVPGMLSPQGKLSIGRFMLDITDIRVGQAVADAGTSNEFWIAKLVPINLLGDASSGQTLRGLHSGRFGHVSIEDFSDSAPDQFVAQHQYHLCAGFEHRSKSCALGVDLSDFRCCFNNQCGDCCCVAEFHDLRLSYGNCFAWYFAFGF